MSKTLIEKDARTPDLATQNLERAFDFIRKNSVLLGILLVAGLVIAGGLSFWNHTKEQKEVELQEQMALIEKEYFDKKNEFKEAKDQAEMKKAADKDPKKKADKKAEEPTKAQASGDLQKDYGPQIEKFNNLIAKNPDSRAAGISALYVAEMHLEYKQPEKALEVLEKVTAKSQPHHMVSALALNMKAGLMADQGQCDKAVTIWQALANQKQVRYMHGESKLRMGLCYEKLNEKTKAEQIYSELSNPKKDDEQDQSVAEEAKKYLRLLRVQSNKESTTTGGT